MALQSAFDIYLAYFSRNAVKKDGDAKNSEVAKNRGLQIRGIVERSESTGLFTRLVKETQYQFSNRPGYVRDGHNWRIRVQNVLRRSRIYASAITNEGSPEEHFQSFVSVFSAKEIITNFLAPLEFVQFSKNVPLEFGSFRVKKFSVQELATILENDTRIIFYPDSTVDIRLLSNYWWLVVSERSQLSDLNRIPGIELIERQPVERTYSDFPSGIFDALQPLVLYDWTWELTSRKGRRDIDRYLLEKQTDRWFGFDMPFLIQSGGSLIYPPTQMPDVSCLNLEPFLDSDGEEVGQSPVGMFYMDTTETRSFSRIVVEFQHQLSKIRSQTGRWKFIDVTVSHLVKAFFSHDLDQFFWHIVAIESLLGEDTKALTEMLARRCGMVLGASKKDRQEISLSFKKLYTLRSDLVHGNTKLRNHPHEGYLAVARYIARDIAVWFLQFLSFLSEDLPEDDGRNPNREDLLSTLEMGKEERRRLSYLMDRVPGNFPSKQCWGERGG